MQIFTARELENMHIDPPEFIIPGILPTGATLLCAPSKIGKSWMALDLAAAVADGRNFWNFPTKKATVLYLALEDSQTRLKDRLSKILDGRPFPDSLYLTTHAPTLDGELINDLNDFVKNHEDTKLVIIDVLQLVRGEIKNKFLYGNDYATINTFKKFADRNKLSVMLIHHTRKGRDERDGFNDISGTGGLMGCADSTWIIRKNNRTDQTAKLDIIGRDVTEETFEIMFDKDTCRWKIQGRSAEIAKRVALENPLRKTIIHLLQENPEGWQGTAGQILKSGAENKTEISCSNLKIGEELEKIQDILLENDSITYTTKSNGNAGKKYCFQYVNH